MSEASHNGDPSTSVESTLREELARGGVILAGARPILRQLLANDDYTLFSDAVIARIRGMAAHIERLLALELARDIGHHDRGAFAAEHEGALAPKLLANDDFLAEAHALVVEALLAERMQQRSGIDPVLSPLVQELAASTDPNLAASAMQVLSAQARFIQTQRRMEWPLGELPGDLFHFALAGFAESFAGHGDTLAHTLARLRAVFNESDGRIGRMMRLLTGIGRMAPRALDLHHAGPSLFITALSLATEVERHEAVQTMGEAQGMRLALTLRMLGQATGAIAAQLGYLHPELQLPEDFEAITSKHAADILATAPTGLRG